MNIPVFSAMLLAAGLIAGCSGVRALAPQQSTAAQVRDRLGNPTDIRFAPDGEELWEYARGPMGTETWLVRIGRDGKVKEIAQLLTGERFDRIVPGKSTKPEVRDLLGRPSDQSFFDGEAVWSWRVLVSPQLGWFHVRFTREGVVKEKLLLLDVSAGERERRSRSGRGGRD
ncbi:MAG TPA: hypothetical protein VNK67_11670 [Burkholderiales bacterium]|nr:hypothetical protein [Burkholderiales bacterium]